MRDQLHQALSNGCVSALELKLGQAANQLSLQPITELAAESQQPAPTAPVVAESQQPAPKANTLGKANVGGSSSSGGLPPGIEFDAKVNMYNASLEAHPPGGATISVKQSFTSLAAAVEWQTHAESVYSTGASFLPL